MSTTTDYKKQAQDFLDKTGTVYSAKYLRTGLYFPDDKEPRDIYQTTLIRNGRAYTCEFGQSVTCSGKFIIKDRGKIHMFRERKEATKWCSGHGGFSVHDVKSNENFEEPDAYTFLATLEKNDPGTFENFCADFGYDAQPLSEYPKVMKTYNLVCEQYLKIMGLFNNEEMEMLREIN